MRRYFHGSWAAWDKLYKAELFENIRYPVGEINEDEAIVLRLLAKQFPAVSLARRKLLGKLFSGKIQKGNVFAQIFVHLLLSLQDISAALVAFFDEIPEHCAAN